jgi:hypothetical protein
MRIYNLTQHPATPEQKAQGVIDLPEVDRRMLGHLLTFEEIPSQEEMSNRALAIVNLLADIAPGGQTVMIGGAPFFMSTLEGILIQAGHTPVYAFSRRVSVETQNPDGSVTKTNKFVHEGFVQPTVFSSIQY